MILKFEKVIQRVIFGLIRIFPCYPFIEEDDMRRIVAMLIMVSFALTGAFAEYVPMTAGNSLYVVDTETGKVVSYAEGDSVIPFGEFEKAIPKQKPSFPSWLHGCWTADDGSMDTLIITEDSYIVDGVGLESQAFIYSSDYASYLSAMGSIDFLNVNDDTFLVATDNPIVFRRTDNPNLIFMEAGSKCRPIIRYDTGFASILQIPEWMHGIWVTEGETTLYVTDNDAAIMDSDGSADYLSAILIGSSIYEIDGRLVYFPLLSDSATESTYTITFSEASGMVSQTDDPDKLIVSGELFDGETFRVTRYQPALVL